MNNPARLTLTVILGLASVAHARADTAAFDKGMQAVLGDYLKIHAALSSDKLEGTSRAAEQIARSAAGLKPGAVTGEHGGHYKKIPSDIKTAAAGLARAKDIETARAAFKELSKPLAMWASMARPGGIDVVHCSMANGSWLQKAGEIRNPYYGAKMLNCGEVVSSNVAPGHGRGHDMKAHGGGTH